MGKRYAILGGGGSFGIHSALYLLDHADPELVIGIGRNLLRPEPFSLNIEKRPRYEYHAYHVTYELDLLLELLDRKKPQVIVNFAAQGEGAVSWKHSWRFFETNSMALARLSEELQSKKRAHSVSGWYLISARKACLLEHGLQRNPRQVRHE